MQAYVFYQNKIRVAIFMAVQTMRIIGTVGVAVLINLLIDAVSAAVAAQNVAPLMNCMLVCCLYAFTLGAVIFLSERLKAANIKHIMLRIRGGIMRGVLEKDLSDYQQKNSAEYIAFFSQNLSDFEENYLQNLVSIYDSFTGMVIAVFLLFYINPFIAVISIAAMSIPGLIPKIFGKKLGILQEDMMRNTAGYHVKIKDIFSGYEIIRAYRAEKQMEELHHDSSVLLENSKARTADTMACLYALVNMASIAVQFLIMSLAGIFAVRGSITIGSIIAVTQLTGQVISPAFQLSAKISQLKGVRPVCEQMEANLLPADAGELKADLPEMERTLTLEDVSFAYDNAVVIDHVSLQFERGRKYAVVGRSGSGKSTLLKLLAGYYDNYSGRILADGESDRKTGAAWIHQEVCLFDDTIRNNITLYKPYDEDEIKRACHLAGLDDVLGRLPAGLDTEAAENGSRFSGGERQRIAVARAILHRKNLFLLDEATSALDSETTEFVEDSILSLENVTCIAVTHKLTPESLRKYDDILVMEHGKIVEQGSFDRLSALSGTFAALCSR
jgi:ABC-type multidrug transport system fused ATPase/permease subunit